MCGIIGYRGTGKGPAIVIQGLKKLEYRGYDSWGIAVKSKDRIKVRKETGQIGAAKGLDATGDGSTAIGHTRWATHGNVSRENAHPHMSTDNKIAVVHNGIIDNYQELKTRLANYKFVSQTDTEVIPLLIKENMDKGHDFTTAVRLALNDLDGTFAIVAMHEDYDQMICAKKGSPLVIGVGDNEFFVASDSPAFVEHTRDAIILKDNDMAVIRDNIGIMNYVTGEDVQRDISRIDYSVEDAGKGDYEHFMLKEIHEQPDVVNRTIQGRISKKRTLLPEVDIDMKKVKRIVMVGCGTAYYACLVGEYMIESISGIRVETEYASEFRYRKPLVDRDTLVIAVTQSGETADTLAAIQEAKRKKAKTLSVVNVVGSSIARESDQVVYTRAGPEIGVASTKAFTSQLCVLYLLANMFAGKDPGKIASVGKLIGKILKDEKRIMEIADQYHLKNNFLYLGRGINFPIALEGALKLKEISYIHAEGQSAAEMKHGPIALIDNQMPCVFIAPKDSTYSKIVGNIEEVKARGGSVIAIATQGDEQMKKLADDVIFVPKEADEMLQPLLTVIPLQIIAYYIANYRNCEIDKPRNLAKSVTVE
ncbi:glutamine--fructose-6-phosphate transaminase (isomerizing) [Candidatus Woesearchaeota archaeon]|nr:glutamine--fructose-6-phosphate transaminase (isomerizing) [Candidatus Woesearchaeota archaeon]